MIESPSPLKSEKHKEGQHPPSGVSVGCGEGRADGVDDRESLQIKRGDHHHEARRK